MKSVFIDANVILDFLDSKSPHHSVCCRALETAFQFYKVYTSPTCFAIVYYRSKKSSRKKLAEHNQMMNEIFSDFEFTAHTPAMMKSVLKSSFSDLEDALQYYAALDADVDYILTKNFFDFHLSEIPVVIPEMFIQTN